MNRAISLARAARDAGLAQSQGGRDSARGARHPGRQIGSRLDRRPMTRWVQRANGISGASGGMRRRPIHGERLISQGMGPAANERFASLPDGLCRADDPDILHMLRMVRPRGLEPPLVAQLAPQASASTNSATAADIAGSRERSRLTCNRDVNIRSKDRRAARCIGAPDRRTKLDEDRAAHAESGLHSVPEREEWCGREDSNLHWLPN
jgi:hypothetical protein